MKKIIRILADKFGVSKDIENETAIEIGKMLHNNSTWLTSSERAMTGNCLLLIGQLLQHKKYIDISKIRATIDDLGNGSLHKEENKNDLIKIMWGIKHT